MKVMVELQHGVVRTFTKHMEVIGASPMIVMHAEPNGDKIRLGEVRRIFTTND